MSIPIRGFGGKSTTRWDYSCPDSRKCWSGERFAWSGRRREPLAEWPIPYGARADDLPLIWMPIQLNGPASNDSEIQSSPFATTTVASSRSCIRVATGTTANRFPSSSVGKLVRRALPGRHPMDRVSAGLLSLGARSRQTVPRRAGSSLVHQRIDHAHRAFNRLILRLLRWAWPPGPKPALAN